MIASITAYVTLASALAAIAASLVAWWIKNRPEAKRKRRRRENIKLHNEVYSGDDAAVNARINQLRAEDD